MALPTDEPLITVWDEFPGTLEEAARRELRSLWRDLDGAMRMAFGGVWSIRCGQIAFRIVALSRFVGPTHWTEVPVDVLLSGVYQRLYREAGIAYETIDWARVAQVKNR
jgi:hypothetical protein